MRSAIILLLLSAVQLLAAPANWYVAKEVAGNGGDGTSWANAWTNFNAIVWANVQPGDTIWVSGGPAGGTNIYIGDLDDTSKNPNQGTLANPVTIKVAQDSSHNGRVFQIGKININAKYRVIDGSLSSWTPVSVMDTYRVGTNCNWTVYSTNVANQAVNIVGVTGTKVLWLNVYQTNLTVNMHAIAYAAQSSAPLGDGSEIAYNWITQSADNGIDVEGSSAVVTNTFSQVLVHHNLLDGIADNYTQISHCADLYKNVFRSMRLQQVGHPDTAQFGAEWMRCYDNISVDNPGGSYYCQSAVGTNHDIYIFNNLFYSTTNTFASGVSLSGQQDIYTDCSISNVWIFNNTWYAPGRLGIGNPGVFAWNRATQAPDANLTGSVTNLFVLNNAVIGVSPYNNNATLQFPTNDYIYNFIKGFTYTVPQVVVDYNSIGGFSGDGQGIIYGTHGSTEDTNQYATMAAFAADTPYKSNSNATATYVSLTNFDFRIGADTTLKGSGTNIYSFISSICPDATNDIVGNARGSSWDRGAYQSDSSLKLWLSFNNIDWTGISITDDSGWTNTGILFNITNLLSATNNGSVPDRTASLWSSNGLTDISHPLGSYIGVTNTAGFSYLTNGTLSAWAIIVSNQDGNMTLMDTGLGSSSDTANSSNAWTWARRSTAHWMFSVYPTNSANPVDLLSWPDDVIQVGGGTPNWGTAAWHLYTLTFSCTTNGCVAYYDGSPYSTNNMAGLPWIRIYGGSTIRWLCIGAMPHGNDPPWTGTYPNAGYFLGAMDDVRIYNRTLSASEVSGLFSTGATSSSGGSPTPPAATNFSIIKGNGTMSGNGTLQ